MQRSITISSAREAGPYSGHVKSLDGLRGLAVLGVMFSHLFPGNTSGWLQPVGAMLRFGATGVDLFFTLSGFLITGILFDSLSDTGYFRKFYARRTLRIFPLYYGVLLVLFGLTPWLGLHWYKMQWVLLFYLQNTDIAGPFYLFSPGPNLSLDHFWSLAVEEQFYLVWPLAVFLVRGRKRLLWVCLGLSCGALLLRFVLAFHQAVFHTINRNTFCRADSLLAGAALALLLRGEFHDAILRWAGKVFAIVVVTVAGLNLLRIAVGRHPAWLFTFDSSYLALHYTLMALGSAALIALCLRPVSMARTVFSSRLLGWFGKYSYGLYVLHLIALSFMIQRFEGWIGLATSSKGVKVVAAGALSFLVSVIAAYASYNLYEKRFLRLKRRFDYDRSALKEQPAAELAAG